MGIRRAPTFLFVAVCFSGALVTAFAHVELEKYLQQRVTAVVGPTNIDLTVEFLFTSPMSLAARRLIDANGDDTLSSGERRAYLKTVLDRAASQLTLRVDGKPCSLTPLYDPELNLLDSKDLEAHPHVLRLFYFARTPATFGKGSTIVLDNGLWADMPTLVASSVRGKGGIVMSAAANPGLKRPSKLTKTIRVLDATCASFKEGEGS